MEERDLARGICSRMFPAEKRARAKTFQWRAFAGCEEQQEMWGLRIGDGVREGDKPQGHTHRLLWGQWPHRVLSRSNLKQNLNHIVCFVKVWVRVDTYPTASNSVTSKNNDLFGSWLWGSRVWSRLDRAGLCLCGFPWVHSHVYGQLVRYVILLLKVI